MKVPEANVGMEWKDIIYGKMPYNHPDMEDLMLVRQDGKPSKFFANIVDDYLMNISHVIRGEECLKLTPYHQLMSKLLQIDLPEFAHLSPLQNIKGLQLTYKHGDLTIKECREKGYTSEALLNCAALLGWNPPHREDPTVLA